MKKTLEVVLVAAALALGVYVVRQALSRRELAARPRVNPALAPGEDIGNPDSSSAPPRRGVVGLPMIRLSQPAKPARHVSAVPPPAVPAP